LAFFFGGTFIAKKRGGSIKSHLLIAYLKFALRVFERCSARDPATSTGLSQFAAVVVPLVSSQSSSFDQTSQRV
jgi:hypothetical protein